MEETDETSADVRTPMDEFVDELHHLREEAGISYTNLAHRVTSQRIERGMHEAAARTPRSTVYTCFRHGRSRIDTDLLRDIVQALTGDEKQATAWVSKYRDVHRRTTQLRRRPGSAAPVAPSPKIDPPLLSRPPRITVSRVILVLAAGVILNQLGTWASAFLMLSVFLDMVGTCLAAIVLGPWCGVIVGIIHHGLVLFGAQDAKALFVLVNLAGALVWGYGVRRFRMGDSLLRYTLLSIIAAIVCSAIGIPINLISTANGTATGLESSTLSLESAPMSFVTALTAVNLSMSLLDKLVSGFIALVLFTLLHRGLGYPAGHFALVGHLGTPRAPVVPAPVRSDQHPETRLSR